MTGQEDRQKMAGHIDAACREGARLKPACEIAGLDVRTLQRRRTRAGAGDRRPGAIHPIPAHALSPAERARLLEVPNEPRFADMPPARVVPALADEGVYLASESSFSRELRAAGQSRHRGRARAPRTSKVLAVRDALYRQARQANPKRWSGKTRDWSPIGPVTLNPERECVAVVVDATAVELCGVAA